MREEHHSRNHPTHYPNVLHHNGGRIRGILGRLGMAVTGEERDSVIQEMAIRPGEMIVVEKATGTIHLETIVSDRTDATNIPETRGTMRSHHATDGKPDATPDVDRGATNADVAIEMDPLDANQRTRSRSLTSTEKDRVPEVPTRGHESTACTPTCVYLSAAHV